MGVNCAEEESGRRRNQSTVLPSKEEERYAFMTIISYNLFICLNIFNHVETSALMMINNLIIVNIMKISSEENNLSGKTMTARYKQRNIWCHVGS